MILKRNFTLLLILVLTLVVTACEEPKKITEEKEETAEPIVLATVNGEKITENDLDNAIQRVFSESQRFIINDDEKIKQKVLQSLISSKAMMIQLKNSASKNTLEEIEQKTQSYKEELFVKEYLSRNAKPEPVTELMVENYYKENQELFGKESIKTVELLSGNKATASKLDTIISDFSKLDKITDWKNYAKSTESYTLNYKIVNFKQGLLDKKLDNAIKDLKLNEASSVVIISEVPHIARVIDIKTIPPKALAEVSTDIRKRLAPLQLKKAIKKVSEDVVQEVEVVITQP